MVRLSGEFPSAGLSDEGDFEVDGESLEVSLSLDDISFESGNLSLGLDLILGGIEGGLDLVSFEESGTFFKMVLESVEHSVDFVVESTNEVGGIDGGLESFGVELISVSVLVSGFGSSRRGLIKIFEIFGISVGIWDIDTLAGVTGSLEELFHGVNLEEMFVLSELVGEGCLGLSEDWGLASGGGSVELNSEDLDSIESVLVLLELLNEELIGLTSCDVKLNELGGDGVESVVDPVQMVIRVLHLGLDPLSVTSSGLSDLSVPLRDGGELEDGVLAINLLLLPTNIMFFLFLID